VQLSGKRIAVLVENEYQVLEVWYPYLRFREEGAETVAVGPAKKSYASKHGYEIKADTSIDQAQPAGFDAVVIPGGWSPDYMRRTPAMVEFVRAMAAQGKCVAAICHGGWMLCSAGILKGKRATSFFAIKDDMVNAGADWVDEEVVVDGKLVTSRNPFDLPAFCREIIKCLRDRG
jgi:protease I